MPSTHPRCLLFVHRQTKEEKKSDKTVIDDLKLMKPFILPLSEFLEQKKDSMIQAIPCKTRTQICCVNSFVAKLIAVENRNAS
jgi:hypothetical protein